MGDLTTLLTIALVCAAFGFVAGSMLTSIWIDRHSKPTRSRRKPEKAGKEFARILLGNDGNQTSLEIDGEVYTPNHPPDTKLVEKIKPTSELMSGWFQKDVKKAEKRELSGKEMKTGKTKSSGKMEEEKLEVHDMLFEINNIVQEKLKSSPNFDRKVRLAREGTTGVSFWVGETSFTSIDAIPDNQVRDLIKAAVAEWEAHVR